MSPEQLPPRVYRAFESAEDFMKMTRPCLTCGTPTDAARCDGCSQTPPQRAATMRKPRKPRPYRWRRLSERARRIAPWCERCGTSRDLTADHVVPVSLGGPMIPSPEGIRVLCRSCNSAAIAEQREEHQP